MKKILLFAFGALLLVTLCTSCTSSKRFDTAAEDRGVKSLSEQVVEAIKADADFQTLTYKAHKDEIVWVSNKKGRKGWQIQAYNPNPIMSKFERFVRLRWLHKDVSFVGSFKSVKLTDDEQESILEALQPLFDKLQKDYIEKTSKKYHQVEWPGDRGADDVNDDQLNSTFPLLFQKGIFVTCISPLYDYHSLTFSLFWVFVYLLICVFVMWVVTVYITDAKGVKHTILVPSDGPDSIMDLAEKQGLELPYSCRSGACYSCCATVNAGKEFLEQNKTGEQLIDVEPDEFLCCIWGIKPDAFTESPDAPQGRVIDLTMLN